MKKETHNQYSILGCGWLGKPLAKKLIQKGVHVKGSTTSSHKLEDLRDIGIDAYLLNIDQLTEDIQPFLEAGLLIIALPSKNISGFETLISHIEQSVVKKVIFISSTSVYDDSQENVNEESKIKQCPLADIERLFDTNIHFKTTIIRFAGLLGYDRKPGRWFSTGAKIPNPEGVVNMIHQDDCIEIILQIIEKNIWGETFNACADSHPSRRDFYTQAKIELGLDPPSFTESDIYKSKRVSNTKLKSYLDFSFKYPDLMNIEEK